ncbi:uncharacterized protein LOC142362798 [Opisthocomus hoazin]|uniref:uncharacterized protein LOC142362798 n=1 Tax=Opisthocomus hoazin TaxID=30419 RepID=UPI003F531818
MAPPRSASASARSAAARPPDRPPAETPPLIGPPRRRAPLAERGQRSVAAGRGGGEGGGEVKRGAAAPPPPRARADGSEEAGLREGTNLHWPTCPDGAAAHWPTSPEVNRAAGRFRGGAYVCSAEHWGGPAAPPGATKALAAPPPPPPRLFESVLLPRQRGALVGARRRKRGLPETRRRGEALGGGAAAGGCWGRGSATGVSGAWVPPGAAARPRLPDGHRWAGAESRHDIRAGSCPRQASALAFEEAAPRGSSWWSPLTSATARVPRRSGVRLRKGLVKAPAGAEGAGEPQQHGAHGLSTRPRRSLRDSSNEPNRWLSQRGRSVLLGEPPAVVPLGLWKREKRGRPCLRRATEPPREAQFLETTALVPVLPSALARLSRLLRAVAVLPPVTFALPSSRVTPEVPVGPATPTRWPSSAGCECLLHICISHWTSSARAPWCHQGKPNAVASPKEESSSWSGSSHLECHPGRRSSAGEEAEASLCHPDLFLFEHNTMDYQATSRRDIKSTW